MAQQSATIQNPNYSVTYLNNYREPDFFISKTDLIFTLREDQTLVHATLAIEKNPNANEVAELVLDGEELTLTELILDGEKLDDAQYQVSDKNLIIKTTLTKFILEIKTIIYPQNNTQLSGLYKSKAMFCTQCEAEGFRRITYYLDRPDVMSIFTVTIHADKTKYPVLLANGNKVASGTNGADHWVSWHDPFKKPSYLFALVAGDLSLVKDQFITCSKRKISLELYVEKENINKCQHALDSLKKAMLWDEQNYKREYDLDIYMIVAVNDFNMGAMENKGLNIFNSKYVLADNLSATDQDFQNIEAVIAHEYFHNWTGNRITLKNWFQLSLKEGLTVFREQQFSADQGSRTVKRINDTKIMRTRQYAEDSGPLAHPVRPDSYMEINNFYTMTVYHKGAEVIRMLETLLGQENFRKGMDLYFTRYDGQAISVEDFLSAMSEANNVDLTQFFNWYTQAGTPEITAQVEYLANKNLLTIDLSQECPDTPDFTGQKQPFVIPVKINLIAPNGQQIEISDSETINKTQDGSYLILTEFNQKFVLQNITAKPVVSLLGHYSAPVKLNFNQSSDELITIAVHDTDLFNRWEAVQSLTMHAILEAYAAKSLDLLYFNDLFKCFAKLFQSKITDPELFAQLIAFPSFDYIEKNVAKVNPALLLKILDNLQNEFCLKFYSDLTKIYELADKNDDESLNSDAIGWRALKSVCLKHLGRLHMQHYQDSNLFNKEFELVDRLISNQFAKSKNMTNTIAALNAVNHSDLALRDDLLAKFYTKWQHDPLVVNKWLSLNAMASCLNCLSKIKEIATSEVFDINNPNNVYALIRTFALANPKLFHAEDGSGYNFIAQSVINIDNRNPQVAAHLVEPLTGLKKYTESARTLMRRALETILKQPKLSDNVYELVSKAIK